MVTSASARARRSVGHVGGVASLCSQGWARVVPGSDSALPWQSHAGSTGGHLSEGTRLEGFDKGGLTQPAEPRRLSDRKFRRRGTLDLVLAAWLSWPDSV